MGIRALDLSYPVATVFFNARGEVDQFFIQNNPWKTFASDTSRKNFRYCVICGSVRFSPTEWSTVARNRLGSTTNCNKIVCSKLKSLITEYIPTKHYMIVTKEDRNRVQENPEQDFFEKIGHVTSLVRIEKTEKRDPYKFVPSGILPG